MPDKIAGKNKIHLTENGELIKTDLETAESLTNFFQHSTKSVHNTGHSNNELLIRISKQNIEITQVL